MIRVIDRQSGSVRFETSSLIRDAGYEGNVFRRTPLEFAPDGQSFAFVRQVFKCIKRTDGQTGFAWPRESTIVWLDSRTGHTRREILIDDSNVGGLPFSPDGRLIAAVTSSSGGFRTIRIFRLRDKKEIQTIETRSSWITALSFSPDGNQIAAGLCDTSIVIWNVRRTD